MRLHPGVGFPLERYVPKGGAYLSGYFLPEGTIVGMNAWVVHQDKTVFGEDADQFRPERWIESDEEKMKAMNRAFLSVSSPHPKPPNPTGPRTFRVVLKLTEKLFFPLVQ